MSALEVRQEYVMDEDGVEWLSRSEYQARHKKSTSTMQRALREGRVPGAVKNAYDEWLIPADAPILRTAPERVESQELEQGGSQDVARRTAAGVASPTGLGGSAGPLLVPVADFAAALGTTVGGVRRLGEAGHLAVGPWGRYGALMVYLGPR